MNEFSSERPEPWNIYASSNSGPPQTGLDQQPPRRNSGTSMNAISFGFVATAILVCMFLLMAIFEHLFRPDPFSSPQDTADGSLEPGSIGKHRNPQTVSTSYAPDFSVLMPGQQCPTYIAQPAPLPCTREGVYWPPHEQNFAPP